MIKLQNIIKTIDNEIEIIKQQMDEIWNEWINRYCIDDEGIDINDYADAHELAFMHGEKFLCGMWDLMQTKVDKLEKICIELHEVDKI